MVDTVNEAQRTLLLTAACVVFAAYDYATSRERLVREITTLADVVGSNSTAALAFEDHHAASETLAAVAALPHVVGAQSPDLRVRNPVHAVGGADPEPLANVRLHAPTAFRSTDRAVTGSSLVGQKSGDRLRQSASEGS